MAGSRFTWHDLDDRAVAYARQELQKGKSLARACLGVLSECRPKAWLPTDMPADKVHQFDGSVSAWAPRAEAVPAESLWAFLREDDPGWRHVIVFEDPYARPTDPFITEGRAGTPVAFLGDEVYQLVEPYRAGDSLALPVGERPLIGVASRLAASSAALSHCAEMAPDVIQQLADNASAVLVGAWDAENYVVLDRGLLS